MVGNTFTARLPGARSAALKHVASFLCKQRGRIKISSTSDRDMCYNCGSGHTAER